MEHEAAYYDMHPHRRLHELDKEVCARSEKCVRCLGAV